MKQTYKQILGLVIIPALVIGTATAAFAHGGFGPAWDGHHSMMGGRGMMGGPGAMHGPGGGPGWMMGGNPVTATDQTLTELKTRLGITNDQEDIWNAYAKAVQDRAGLMQSHRQIMVNSGGIAPEQRFAFHQQGLEQMQKLHTASRDLYNALTPEQQTNAGNLSSFLNCMH